MDLSRPKVSVTITFSVPGTHPPVYVASSLTNPPWAPVEMSIKDERTPAGDLVFEKSFDAVESGEYQYKFRLGPGDWWVCDENAPIVSDEAGNRNNLLVVTPPQSPALDRGETSSARSTLSTPEVENLATSDEPEDGEGSGSPLDTAPDPLPSTVVDQVPNAEQPAYSDKKPASLGEASRSTAEAEPALEPEPAEANSSHSELDSQKPFLLPSVVIEKTDNTPAYGDDLGPNATQGQQEAHAKRAADAEPDKVVVTGDVEEPKELSKLGLVPKSEIPAEISNAEDQHSPLLPHEAFEPLRDEAPLLPHERSTSVSNTESEDDEAAVASTDFAPVEFDGDMPLFRHESISLAASDSPPRSPSQSRPKSHASLKDMMDEEDVNDPSIEPFPTRRETIYEHLQGLANRMEVDRSLPEASETSPRRKNSRSSSSEMLPPPSPLDSIKEDEEIEEEDVNKSPSLMAPAHLVDQSVAAEPTPPLTPKNDVNATRQDRADSLVTVTGEENLKDVKSQASDTDSSKSQLDEPIELPELRPASLRPASLRPPSLAPPVANRDISRPGTSHSAKITPNKQSSSFMINFWNNLFGSWLAPVVRWFSRVCGGRKRATVVALAIGTAIVAYSYQSTLLGTETLNSPDQ